VERTLVNDQHSFARDSAVLTSVQNHSERLLTSVREELKPLLVRKHELRAMLEKASNDRETAEDTMMAAARAEEAAQAEAQSNFDP
jgi:hypothetical protein